MQNKVGLIWTKNNWNLTKLIESKFETIFSMMETPGTSQNFITPIEPSKLEILKTTKPLSLSEAPRTPEIKIICKLCQNSYNFSSFHHVIQEIDNLHTRRPWKTLNFFISLIHKNFSWKNSRKLDGKSVIT